MQYEDAESPPRPNTSSESSQNHSRGLCMWVSKPSRCRRTAGGGGRRQITPMTIHERPRMSHKEGRQEGREEGRKEGRKEIRKGGREEGRTDGRKEGREG